jgi:5-methylcytosine-specific restriction endonuclease McrA
VPSKYAKLRQYQQRLHTRCGYCGRVMDGSTEGLCPSRDHDVPRSAGGQRIVWCCYDCNQTKGDMSPREWREARRAAPAYDIG